MNKNIIYILPLFVFSVLLAFPSTSLYASEHKYSNITFDGQTFYSDSPINNFCVISNDYMYQSNQWYSVYELCTSSTPIYDSSDKCVTSNKLYNTFYSIEYGMFNGSVTDFQSSVNCPYILVSYSDYQNYGSQVYSPILAYYQGKDNFDQTYNKPPKGSADNPILDENIGTLILDKTVMYEESNGDDVNDLYNLWSWKNKTSTGYSLSVNDYARTFIQVKVESKCVVYSDLRHTKVKKRFDNYGEKAILFESVPVEHEPLKISYLKDVPNVLPHTHAESHNPLYVGYDYTLYFRVVCTNDTAVIPSPSAKWYCGGWRACDCNSDILNKQTYQTSNGHFNEDGVWVDDTDDGHNQITSGSDSVTDTDQAKDNFSNYHPSSGMTTDTAIGNLKSLMSMVGYIPTMIATLFSFLPTWCTTLIAVTFASMLVLVVYKLIRG